MRRSILSAASATRQAPIPRGRTRTGCERSLGQLPWAVRWQSGGAACRPAGRTAAAHRIRDRAHRASCAEDARDRSPDRARAEARRPTGRRLIPDPLPLTMRFAPNGARHHVHLSGPPRGSTSPYRRILALKRRKSGKCVTSACWEARFSWREGVEPGAGLAGEPGSRAHDSRPRSGDRQANPALIGFATHGMAQRCANRPQLKFLPWEFLRAAAVEQAAFHRVLPGPRRK